MGAEETRMSPRQEMALGTPGCHDEVVLPHFWRGYWELVWVIRLYLKNEKHAKQTLERCQYCPESQRYAGMSAIGLSWWSMQRAELTSRVDELLQRDWHISGDIWCGRSRWSCEG